MNYKMPKTRIRVIKVPSETSSQPKAPMYNRMPQLYSELVENKEKIKAKCCKSRICC